MSSAKHKLQDTMPTVTEWFNGRNVLVTGATGFMGKVLLEKLLRSIPDIGKIYMLVREKRGTPPCIRVQEIIKLPLFQQLRETNPHVLKKLVPIEGDVIIDNLGLNEENAKLLQTEVSVVFHVAATLKLEAVLKDSVKQNLYGTDNVLKFCKGIKKLESVVHLSTAFCHCDVPVLEEKLYPPNKNPRDVMQIVNWMDDQSLELVTSNIIEPHPNTYTFTKRLAESLCEEYGKELPIVILRPSIVIPTIKEPIPGWVDSLNGPVGVLAAAGKGVIRSMLVEADNHAEIIPVDVACNGMIIMAWYRGTRRFTEMPVYNMTQSDTHPTTWGEVLQRGRKQFQNNPFDWPLWYPDGDIRTNKLLHHIIVFLFQIIPAYFLDVIFMIILQKRFMVRIQKRIRLGMHLLQYFTLREWKIKNHNFLNDSKELNEKESKIFYLANIEFDKDEYLRDIILGTRKFCLKEDLKTLPRARRYLLCLYVLDRICKTAIVCGLFWLLLKISTAGQSFHDQYYDVKTNTM